MSQRQATGVTPCHLTDRLEPPSKQNFCVCAKSLSTTFTNNNWPFIKLSKYHACTPRLNQLLFSRPQIFLTPCSIFNGANTKQRYLSSLRIKKTIHPVVFFHYFSHHLQTLRSQTGDCKFGAGNMPNRPSNPAEQVVIQLETIEEQSAY